MPSNLTYPGVYIEELPSGVHTITGVATSITAFVGRAARGPVNAPTVVESFTDYERKFGGLAKTSRTSYAVRDFFLNGGGVAVIVRLFHDDGTPPLVDFAVGNVKLRAASQGKWGTNLRMTIDQNVSADVALQMGIAKADLFNLKVIDSSPGGPTEEFRNVTLVKAATNRLDKVLADESRLATWAGDNLDTSPTPALPAMGADGTASDAVTEAEKTLQAALAKVPQVPADITNARAALNAATAAIAGKGSDGAVLDATDYLAAGKLGIKALEDVDLFNILCLPPDTTGDIPGNVWDQAGAYCTDRRAMLLVDPPANWKDVDAAVNGIDGVTTRIKNAAAFFPRLKEADPLNNGQIDTYVPCGAVAGVLARIDNQRGVWKAPAGTEATLVGVPELSVPLTDAENGRLNPLGLNCLRAFPVIGRVVWGARTLRGADLLADPWKYLPVRRTALFIEESLFRGTQWVVFEPNDEPLWAQIRLNVGAFMNSLFRQGAFQGKTPQEAYLVKCDKETTTQDDINRGVVNIVVGFAPLKPAEFVIITIQQLAGQITV
jgi:Bacteriophage tail sheath protein